MSVFQNEFGDLVGWRVALAITTAIAVPVWVSVALLGPKAAQTTTEATELSWPIAATAPEVTLGTAEVNTEAGGDTGDAGQAPAEGADATQTDPAAQPAGGTEAVTQDTSELDAWLASTAGSDQLLSLTTESRGALRCALAQWQQDRFGDATSTLTILQPPEVTPERTVVRLRVERQDLRTWAEASIAPGGTWSVAEVPEGLEADPASPIPLANATLLAQVTGEPVASAVSAQVAASGLPGATSAWTHAQDVSREGQVTRLTVWMPVSETEVAEYRCAYDTSVGVIEIMPAALEGVA